MANPTLVDIVKSAEALCSLVEEFVNMDRTSVIQVMCGTSERDVIQAIAAHRALVASIR